MRLAYYKRIHTTLSRGAVSLYAFILCMIKAMCMILIFPIEYYVGIPLYDVYFTLVTKGYTQCPTLKIALPVVCLVL